MTVKQVWLLASDKLVEHLTRESDHSGGTYLQPGVHGPSLCLSSY